WWKLLVVALIFGLINAYLKPIVELLSLPARILTLGLFGLVINAVLLLVLALVSDTFSLGFKLAKFPPHFSLDAFVAALLGAIVISIVSTVLAHFLPDRTSWRSSLHL
ncbi:MAG: phage holin family protein, partial [Devosia sp.]|nr:phage holin family protein [Devosia sp.]